MQCTWRNQLHTHSSHLLDFSEFDLLCTFLNTLLFDEFILIALRLKKMLLSINTHIEFVYTFDIFVNEPIANFVVVNNRNFQYQKKMNNFHIKKRGCNWLIHKNVKSTNIWFSVYVLNTCICFIFTSMFGGFWIFHFPW